MYQLSLPDRDRKVVLFDVREDGSLWQAMRFEVEDVVKCLNAIMRRGDFDPDPAHYETAKEAE